MSKEKVERIEKIAFGDISSAKPAHNKTLKRVIHWQKRIWKASQE